MRILPSSAVIFNCPNLWDSSLPSALSFVFNAFQYFLGLGLPVNTSITSMTDTYHFSCSSSHRVLIDLFSNTFMDVRFSIANYLGGLYINFSQTTEIKLFLLFLFYRTVIPIPLK